MQYFYRGRNIGRLSDGVFRKRVRKSRHLMKKYNSWGIQYDLLQSLKEEGCKEIRVLDEDDEIIYSTDVDTYYKEGIVDNWGDGQQCFLTREKWKQEKYEGGK